MVMVASIAQDMQIKVVIVDDDEEIRASLASLIRRSSKFKLFGEYANAEIALKEIPRHPPDVVLMDINLPGMKGFDCVRQLKATQPEVQFLMLTVYEDSDSLFNSLKAGASGYLLKRTAGAKLLGSHPRCLHGWCADDTAVGAARGAIFLKTARQRARTLRPHPRRTRIPRPTGQRLCLQGNRRPHEYQH